MICPVLLKYPDEFISNTKVVRNSSTNPDTPPTHVSDVHDTSGMIPPPPPAPLSSNQPEPIIHPRMIPAPSLLHHTSLDHRLHFIYHAMPLIAMIAVYLLF